MGMADNAEEKHTVVFYQCNYEYSWQKETQTWYFTRVRRFVEIKAAVQDYLQMDKK